MLDVAEQTTLTVMPTPALGHKPAKRPGDGLCRTCKKRATCKHPCRKLRRYLDEDTEDTEPRHAPKPEPRREPTRFPELADLICQEIGDAALEKEFRADTVRLLPR